MVASTHKATLTWESLYIIRIIAIVRPIQPKKKPQFNELALGPIITLYAAYLGLLDFARRLAKGFKLKTSPLLIASLATESTQYMHILSLFIDRFEVDMLTLTSRRHTMRG